MYRNKKKCFVLMTIALSFVLSACASSKNLMTDTGSGSQKEVNKEDYLNVDALNAPQKENGQGSNRVYTLEKGTYAEPALKQTLERAYINVPIINVEVEAETVLFGEYVYGNMLQLVEAGDVIATVYTEVDEVAIEEAELKLTRLQERFQKAEADFVEAVTELQEEREDISYEYDLKRMDIEEEQLRLDWELEKRSFERDIQDAAEEIEELKEIKNTTEIVTPVAGQLVFESKYAAGEELENGAYICHVLTTDAFYLQTENFSEHFGFGGTMDFRRSADVMTGTVISGGSRALYGNLDTGVTTFLVPFEGNMGLGTIQQVNGLIMDGNMREVNNVILVPVDAVTVEGSNYYVTVLKEDGSLLKTEFLPGGGNAEQYWVYAGLEEGTKVVY